MKRFFTFLLAVLIAALPLTACSARSLYKEGTGELKIVASSFVPFDLARNVTEGRAQITVLQTDGGDLHDYTPTTAALEALASADIFICIGGVSDKLWIEDAKKASGNKHLTVIKLTELAEGELAQTEIHSNSDFCKQNHTHSEHEHTAHDGHGHEHDEHVWTSLKNAIKAVGKIARVCAEKDTKNASFYQDNAQAYTDSLSSLDTEYADTLAASEAKTLIFADRFPFVYLIKDYGLCSIAAFSGCSGELDADFETAVHLTEAVKHNGLRHIIVTEDSDKKLAKSISAATECKILTLNSMQSVSRSEIESGADYLKIMRANLQVLKAALI